jgi:acetyl-CoA acetyltransferase
MKTYGTTREQLASVAVLDSLQAARHPNAIVRDALSLDRVLAAQSVLDCVSSLHN